MKNDTKALIVVGGLGVAAFLFKDKIAEAINSLTKGSDSAGGYGADSVGAGQFSSNSPGIDQGGIQDYPTMMGTGRPWNSALLDWPPQIPGTTPDGPTNPITPPPTPGGNPSDYGPGLDPNGKKGSGMSVSDMIWTGVGIGSAVELAYKGGKFIKGKWGGRDVEIEARAKINEQARIQEEGIKERASSRAETKAAEEGKTFNEKYAERTSANQRSNFNERAAQSEGNAARTESRAAALAREEKAASSLASEGRAARGLEMATQEGKAVSKLVSAGGKIAEGAKVVGFWGGMAALVYEGAMFLNDMATGVQKKGLNIEGLKEGAGAYGYRTLNMFGAVDASAEAMAQQQQSMQKSLQKYVNSPQVQTQLQSIAGSSGSNKTSAPAQNYTPAKTVTTKAAPYAVASAVGGGTIMSDGSIVRASSPGSASSGVPASAGAAQPSPLKNINTPGQVGSYTTSTGGKSTAPTQKLSDYKKSTPAPAASKKK